jgi:ankyrin repeat protein
MCSNFNAVSTAAYLLDKGADIDAQDHNGDLVINWAAYMGEVAFVKLLLEKGSKTNQKSIHSDNTMGVALKEWQDSIVDVLIQYNRGIHEVNPEFKEIIAAVKKKDVTYVKKYITTQNSNAKDAAGNSLLINVATNGSIEIVKLLLKNNVTIDEVNMGGHTALSKAVWSKNNDVAKYLIDQGGDVNKSNKRFELPPLVAAVRNNNIEMGEILLQKGANVNTVNTIDKFTPIIWAVFKNDIDFIKLLLKYHPDLSIKSKYDDRTIFDYAKDKKEIMELLNAYQTKTG